MSAPGVVPRDDAAARARVADALDETLFVGAGAGTGKTTALVGRIVRLVVTGRAELRGIAAITFTEAAAGELRDRVREALERVAAGEAVQGAGPGGAAVEPTAAQQARADAALAEIDQAAITTLHGFAQRILVGHALEADLPPRLTVHDQLASSVAFAERWERFRDQLLDDDRAAEVVLRAVLAGVPLDHLRSLARRFNDSWDLVADHDARVPAALAPVDGTTLRRLLGQARDAEAGCTDDTDRLLAHLRGLHAFVDLLGRTSDGIELLALLGDAPKLASGRKGRKGSWPDIDTVRDLLDDAQAEADRLVLHVARDAVAHLLVELRRLTLDAADGRRAAGTLEFHDLLVMARDLLRTRADVCARLRARFSHLLIDEFQDTDPIQAELAMRIAGTGPPGTPWRDLTVEPGRLFFVGDPKQAIYRFRRADIELYLDMQALLTDEPLSLTRCFRSVPGVLDVVNALFAPLFGDGDGTAQPPYEALAPHRADHGRNPPVVVVGGPVDGSADEVRTAAAAEVARTIRRAVREAWPVGDGDDRRPLRLGDVAVLIPTGAEVPALEAAFEEHGIPFRLETSSLVFDTTEVAEVLAVLRAVDDPGNDLAVVAALRTALYACGDDDLVAWRLAGGRWDPTRPWGSAGVDAPDATPTQVADGPVARAMTHLRSLHHDARWADPPTVVERVLSERHALALALDTPRARDVWRRMRWVADQARAFVESGGTDLRRWLHWLDALAEDRARSSEATLPETDDDAVRVLTMHGSKGLEFPFVALIGLQQQPRADREVKVLWGPTGPEVRFSKDRTTAGWASMAEREAVLERHERLRLLYVAATRAQDHLVLALHHKPGADCHAAAVTALLPTLEGRWRTLDLRDPADGPTGPELAPARSAPALTPTERDAWQARRRTALIAASRPRAVAPTTLAEAARARGPGPSTADTDEPRATNELDDTGDTTAEVDAAATERAPEVDLDGPTWRRGRAGTSLGRAVHGTLQLVDLATGNGLDDLARAQAAAEGVTGRAAQVARLARHALASDTVRRAVDGRAYWRELYVGVPVGDRVLEGFIDLLVDGPDGLTVVDHKTALGADDAEIDRRLTGYRIQGAAYAVAVEALLDRPVERCTFLFLRDDGVVERDLPDLESAKAEVHTLLTAPASP